MSVNTGEFAGVGGDPGFNGQTTTNTPLVLGRFPVPPSTAVLVRVRVIARNPATGAQKVWHLAASVKRNGAGSVTNEATQNPTAMVSAGDSTPMTNCTIAMFSDATDLGVTVTGPNGTAIDWAVWIEAVTVTG